MFAQLEPRAGMPPREGPRWLMTNRPPLQRSVGLHQTASGRGIKLRKKELEQFVGQRVETAHGNAASRMSHDVSSSVVNYQLLTGSETQPVTE